MVHEFSDGVDMEKEGSPILNRWYRSNFRNLLGIIDVTDDLFYRKVGIDKFLIFRCRDVASIVHFSIDEKVRSQRREDILAETWSKWQKEIPGWVWTSKADYIVYAFIRNKELVEPPRFIPTIDFVSAIKTKDYPVNKSENPGWTTFFKLIPKEDLFSKPPEEITLEDFKKIKLQDFMYIRRR